MHEFETFLFVSFDVLLLIYLPWWLSQYRIRLQYKRPGLGRSSRVRNGNPLQYSCLENPMDRGAWWPTVRGHRELDMIE